MDLENCRPAVEEEQIDVLNDETFGDGAVEDDWEASHLAKLGGEGVPLPDEGLHHDDAILGAITTTTAVGQNGSHTPKSSSAVGELDSSLASLNLKSLWPSSPKQSSTLESIWSSPELPRPRDATPPRGGVPPGAISLEELERTYTSSPPPPNHTPPTIDHTPLPSQYSRSTPPPPHMMYLPPHGRMPLPLHPLMRGGWMVRGPPPPPHLLPPHMMPRPLPHPLQHPPPITGVRGYPVPPPHSTTGPPPRYLLPHPPLLPPHSLTPSPPHHTTHQRPRNEQQQNREPSRRSELLGEMKRDGSGFMTQREKEWVVKIQLLQLQGADPENDDYYYLNYVKRKAMKESAESASFSLALPQVSREEKNYQPVKFEQTLGKLSQSSLSAPRKMIDAPISLAGGGEGGGREVTTRKRQVLLIIEKLYSLVLALEDLDKRALVLPEVERGVVSTRKEEICSEIFDLLRLKTLEKAGKGEEQIFQLMTSYRKGKRLLKRVIPILTDAHAQAVLLAILRNMLLLLKRDFTDQVLPDLIPAVKGVINQCDLQLVTRYILTLMQLPPGSKIAPPSIVKVASHEFGSALLLILVRKGNVLRASPYNTPDLRQEWLTITDLLCSTLTPHSSLLSSLSTNSTLLATLSNSLQ